MNNPVNAIDPNGKDIVFITKIGGKTTHFQYTVEGNLKNVNTGQIYDGSKIGGHLGDIVDGYNKMLNSGDENYVNQITTLIKSKNVHEVDTREVAGSEVAPGSGIMSASEALKKASNGEKVGTTTKFNFKKDIGIETTNYTTVAHEVQHQFDFDQGNMKDSINKDGKLITGNDSPAEQRAIKNEDFAREQEELDKRRKY